MDENGLLNCTYVSRPDIAAKSAKKNTGQSKNATAAQRTDWARYSQHVGCIVMESRSFYKILSQLNIVFAT